MARFAIVGFTGFGVDNAVLAALHYGGGWDPLSARVVSILVAVVTTWRLNRSITFSSTSADQASEGLRYLMVTSVTIAINYVVFALFLLAAPRLPPVFGVTAGAAAAMGFSYVGYSVFVFSSARPAVMSSPSEQSR